MTTTDPTTARVYRPQEQPKPWGRELVFAAVEGRYVGKLIHVDAGHSLSCQYHREKEETISVISGRCRVEHGLTPDALQLTELGPGDTIHLPAGVIHRLEAITDAVFAECSTAFEGWRHDVVRLGDRYGREGTSAP